MVVADFFGEVVEVDAAVIFGAVAVLVVVIFEGCCSKMKPN